MEFLAARLKAKLHIILKRTTDRRRDTGTEADGIDAKNTRLEVKHSVKEIASQRAFV